MQLHHSGTGSPAGVPGGMRVGYFGGSFDPPHLGHLEVAQAARDRFQLDRVLLAPTGRQPLKPHGPEAPFADRLRMTELLCAGEPGVPGELARWGGEPGVPGELARWGGQISLEASDLDAPQPDGTPNYTVDTLRRLRSSLSGCDPRRGSAFPTGEPEIFAIVGADAFAGLRQWREPDDLLLLAQWIVVSRPGFSLDLGRLGFTPAQRVRVHTLDGLANPISATAVRGRLHSGLDCRGWLPESVEQFLHAKHLYAAR